MRSNQEIEAISSTLDSPRSIPGFLSDQEIQHLISLFESSDLKNDWYEGKIKKNTGPITLDHHLFSDDACFKDILQRLKTHIGDFEITASLFFQTDYPHIIHNDDTFELPNSVYKAITLPLKLYGDNVSGNPYLCFFDQLYFHGPAKFFNGDTDIETYFNKQVYSYENVSGLSNETFRFDTYLKYFTHLKYQWLEGLSLNSCIPWVPGDAIVFDSVRLHCASDFRKQGIRKKLGLSIFTKK